MILKKYEVRGMMEWHPVFKVGRSHIKVSFTGGHLCSGGCTPASFETADPVVQKVIESSPAFKSRRISVGMVKKIPDTAGPSEAVAKTQTGYVFEYENIKDVYALLEDTKGVPLSKLNDEVSCFREAEKLGIILKKKES
ncbi:MAG: hypothetical protein K2J46_11295 [Muribaculaceae bacterium]|nr:hypothetical protein [Muribaculaceae bacterium]